MDFEGVSDTVSVVTISIENNSEYRKEATNI